MFGLQARDKLKELVEGKGVCWNGPVERPHKATGAVFMRDAKGESLAKQLLAAGLAWAVEDELMGKPAQPGGEKKPWPEAAEWIAAAREPAEVQHQVEISRGFYLGATEVTVGQFRKFVAETGYKTSGEAEGTRGGGVNPDSGKMESGPQYTWKNTGFPQTDEHPVVIVSWTDADAFCRWLAKKESRDYRLPTEAEWECACRAGTKTAYSCGATVADLARVGFKENAAGRFTVPVGGFEKNAFGLFDMHGNAWEWCQDFYDPKGYAGGRQTDPKGPATGMARVIGRDPVSYRGSYQGFRVALTGPDAVEWKTAP